MLELHSPRFAPSLTVTVDRFDIERHDVIGAPGGLDILNREARGKLLHGEQVLRDASGTIIQIVGPYENFGDETARGIDFGLTYQIATSLGLFAWQTDATWLESFRLAITKTAPALEVRSQGARMLFWSGKAVRT